MSKLAVIPVSKHRSISIGLRDATPNRFPELLTEAEWQNLTTTLESMRPALSVIPETKDPIVGVELGTGKPIKASTRTPSTVTYSAPIGTQLTNPPVRDIPKPEKTPREQIQEILNGTLTPREKCDKIRDVLHAKPFDRISITPNPVAKPFNEVTESWSEPKDLTESTTAGTAHQPNVYPASTRDSFPPTIRGRKINRMPGFSELRHVDMSGASFPVRDCGKPTTHPGHHWRIENSTGIFWCTGEEWLENPNDGGDSPF